VVAVRDRQARALEDVGAEAVLKRLIFGG
jgi:hypothetical protein